MTDIKAAFFDIDGVLSVPRYCVDGIYRPGGSTEWWKKFTKNNPEAYKDCIAPAILKDFIKALRNKGAETHFLSTEAIPAAKKAKSVFIENQYKGLIDHGEFVSQDEDKIRHLKSFAAKNGIEHEEIYFLDDTFNLVLLAVEARFNSHHISEFLVSPTGLG